MTSIAIPSVARAMGIHFVAPRGAGKSRDMGRLIAFKDFLAGIPLIIIDPTGPTIDNFLDKLMYLDPEDQRILGKRIKYLDMSGKSKPAPGFPLYYQLPG